MQGSKRIVDKLKRKGARDEAPAGTRLYAQAEAMRQQQEDRRRAAENKHRCDRVWQWLWLCAALWLCVLAAWLCACACACA